MAAALLAPADGLAWERPALVPERPSIDAPVWYSFEPEKFSRSDGATALYESTRRQVGPRPGRSAQTATIRDE